MGDLGALDQMRAGAQGFTCRVCLLSGVPQTQRRDGSALDESDRCAGCGETVCDRHPRIDNNRHNPRQHGAPGLSA